MKTPEDLRELIIGFEKSRVILTALELGIFSVIDNSSMTSKSVSESLQTCKKTTDRLMNALVVLELLEKKDELFNNTEFSTKYLNQKSPDFLSGLFHYSNMWEKWNLLTKCIQSGTSQAKHDVFDSKSLKKVRKSFIDAMHQRASKTASSVISQIEFNEGSKLLDIGGGSGVYSMAFTDAKKKCSATVLDLPEIIPISKQYIKTGGYKKVINTYSADYIKDNFPKGYDVVLLSAIVHINSNKENIKLIKKSAKSLNENGQIVILDWAMNDQRTSPESGVFFALNMITATKNGDTYTLNEMKHWFEKAKLVFEKCIELPSGNSIIIARKIKN